MSQLNRADQRQRLGRRQRLGNHSRDLEENSPVDGEWEDKCLRSTPASF